MSKVTRLPMALEAAIPAGIADRTDELQRKALNLSSHIRLVRVALAQDTESELADDAARMLELVEREAESLFNELDNAALYRPA